MKNNRIGQLRRECGLNQRELGEKLGVGQTTVSAWETGKNEPDGEAMGKMAELFQVSIGYLMGHEAESLTRGLAPEKYEALVRESLRKREEQQREREITRPRDNLSDMTEEEIEEIIKDEQQRRFLEGRRPETLEGFLASEIIDELPASARAKILQIVKTAADLTK